MEHLSVRNATLLTMKVFFVGILIVVFTFPENNWFYSIGVDPPLTWVFNHIFETGLSTGKGILFPHGPLAFFMYPLPENILLVTLVISLLKILLVFNIALLSKKSGGTSNWVFVFAAAYFISIISGFNQLILANIILTYCVVYLSGYDKLKFLGYLLTAFAIYVKAYVAILSVLLSISYIGYNLFFNKKGLKESITDSFALAGFTLFFWIIMYGSPAGFITYLQGMAQLAQDNSSAAAYYPHNNWLLIGLFLFTLPLLAVLNRRKEFYFFACLIGLSLFGAWKHGISRQDIYHVKGMYLYFVICSIIFLIFYKRKTLINIGILSAAYILLSVILTDSVAYRSSKYELFRVNNFVAFILEFDALKKHSETTSRKQIAINKLPDSILDSIGNASVDVYPWDYSIVSSNHLNWQPRKVISSYASYTSWLDQQNSAHFQSNNSPEFLIWQIEKTTIDFNGSNFNSIDNRYLLNDEPNTIITLLQHYHFWHSTNRFLILKKRSKALTFSNAKTSEKTVSWSAWIDVPDLPKGQLLRAKLNFEKTFLQRLKSFVYKDEHFWIHLKLQNGSTHKYRIVPKNAVDGLWITPYLHDRKGIYSIKEIMFRSSNNSILSQSLSLSWETYQFNTSNVFSDYFDVSSFSADSIVVHSLNDFEHNQQKYWGSLNEEATNQDGLSKSRSQVLKPGKYSCTFEYPLDSINYKNLRIVSECWVKAKNYKKSNDIKTIISIDKNSKNIKWKGKSIDEQLIDCNDWNHLYNFVEYKNSEPGCVLKVYLWNKSNEQILIDDFSINVFSK